MKPTLLALALLAVAGCRTDEQMVRADAAFAELLEHPKINFAERIATDPALTQLEVDTTLDAYADWKAAVSVRAARLGLESK